MQTYIRLVDMRRLSLKRGVWIAAVALFAVVVLVSTRRVHSFGMEGPGYSVGGLVPWAVLVTLPLLLLAAVLRSRLPRVSIALALAASVFLAVSLALDLTGLSWIVDLLSWLLLVVALASPGACGSSC